MPKQTYKIENFHGGLSSNSDPRDISDTELSEAQDIMVDELGKVRTMGGTATHGTIDAGAAAINPGYGLFQFSSDRLEGETSGNDAAKTGDNYLALADTDGAANIDIWSESTDNWGAGVIDLGSTTGMKPCFYYVDGALRVSDGNFGADNANKWYGYVYSKLYQTTAGTAEHLIDEWSSQDQQLKSLDDLSVALVLDDCNAANPNTTSVTGTDRIVIGWWSGDDGTWNGRYYIGISPVYMGNQEGPISIPDQFINSGGSLATHNGTIMLNKEKLNLQLFLCQSTSATIADNAAHLLKDDRIVGLRLYARPYSSEKWYLLQEVDLQKGGKHGWSDYNAANTTTGFTTGTPYARFNNDSPSSSEVTMIKSGVSTVDGLTSGSSHTNGTYTDVQLGGGSGGGVLATVVISGNAVNSVTITTNGAGYTENDALTIPTATIGGSGAPHCDANAMVYLQEYSPCTANFEVDMGDAGLGTNSDGTDRTGALRVTGFQNSPLYTEINLNSTSEQDVTITGAVLPSTGDVTFTFDILDEQWNSLFSSTQVLTIVANASSVAPVDPEADEDYGGS